TSITMPGMNEIPGLFVSPGSSGDIADLTPVSVQGPGGSAGMSRYLFRYDVVSGTWQAGNSYQRIGILTTQDGRVILSAANGSAVMLLAGIGRGDTLTRSPVNTIHADGNRLEILHGTTKEWYVNGRSGIEQGMTIPTRPEGRGSLTISYALAGDLRPALLVGQALLLSDQYGPVIVYGGLKARDATGKVLPSGMLRDGNRLNWQIDDRDAVYPVTIDPVVVSASKATATFTGVAANDEFGYSTALSSDGSTALVGALQNGTAGTNAGAAYIFVKPAGGWSGTTSASAANATFTGGAANDNFGYSTALSSDGSTALVGAWQNGTAGTNAGAAYIFVKPAGGWSGTTSASAANATFTGGAANDNFGYSTALSSDGSTALVGANQSSTAGTKAGAAYIFTK